MSTFDTLAHRVHYFHYFYIKAALMAVGYIGGWLLSPTGEPNGAFLFAGVVSLIAAMALHYFGE
jgi:hypothetical protein